MRWTTLRGLKKLSMQAMLTFAALNLIKIADMERSGNGLETEAKRILSSCINPMMSKSFQGLTSYYIHPICI